MEMPRKQKLVYDYIISLIDNGMRQGDLLPSLSELQESLKISQMTISRAIEHLIEMDIIYKIPGKGTFVGNRNFEQQGLEVYKSESDYPGIRPAITFLSPFLHNDNFMKDFTNGIVDSVDHERYSLINRHVWVSRMREELVLADAAAQSKGMIVVSSTPPPMRQVLRELTAKNYPLVMLDNWPEDLLCHSVSIDNEDAVREALQYFFDRGHRKIAYFTSNAPLTSSTFSRLHAYKSFMLRHSLEAEVVKDSTFFKKSSATACLCMCDQLAVQLKTALEAEGRRVPDDMSIIGINGDIDSEEASITTMAQPKYKMGCKAVELLNAIFEGECPTYMRYFYPASLIERASVKNIKKRKT